MLEEAALFEVTDDQKSPDQEDQNVETGGLRESLDGQQIADHQQGDAAEGEGEAEVAEQEGAVDEHREDADAQNLAVIEYQRVARPQDKEEQESADEQPKELRDFRHELPSIPRAAWRG